MILVRKEIVPPGTVPWFDRTVYLTRQLGLPVIFSDPGDNERRRLLAAKGILSRPRQEWFESGTEDVQAILYDGRRFDALDRQLLDKFHHRGIASFQIIDRRQSALPVDLAIRPCLDHCEKVGEARETLSGPRYAMLHHAYRHFHGKRPLVRSRIRRLFLNIGETLDYRRYRHLIEGLVNSGYSLKINPPGSWRKAHRKTLKRLYPGIRFVGKVDSLARAYYENDVSVVDGEQSVLETLCVGTPFLFLSTGSASEELRSAIEPLGSLVQLSSDSPGWQRAVIGKIENVDSISRKELVDRGKSVVDGKGVWRIAAVIRKSIKG